MGFTDPIASGGGALIREAFRSPNYDPGAEGWTVNRDGTVEFGAGTFRGAARFVQPARKVKRMKAAIRRVAGTREVTNLETDVFATGTNDGSEDDFPRLVDLKALRAARRAVYNGTIGARVSPVASPCTYQLVLRRTADGVPITADAGDDLIGSGGTLQQAGGTFHLSASVPVLMEAGDHVFGVLFMSTDFDLQPGETTSLTLAYSSEAP